MAMKKEIKSGAEVVVAGGAPASACPKGFKYAVGGTIYTVKDRFYSDNTEWRRLVTDQGVVEDVTLATVIKDLKDEDCNIIADPNRPQKPKKAEKEEEAKEQEGE